MLSAQKLDRLPEFDDVRSDKHGLHSPLGQFAGVMFQLISQHSASLGVQLLAPVNISGEPRVPLVQRLNVHELNIFLGAALDHSIVFTTGYKFYTITKVP